MKYKGGKGRIADEILAIMLNSMLPDFECVWEKQVKNTLNDTRTYTATEKLWTIKN